MKPRLYMETTIPSLLTARPSKLPDLLGKQIATRKWWDSRLNDFEVFVSQRVWDEAAAGDAEMAARRLEAIKPFPLLQPTEAVHELEESIMALGFIPRRAAADAMHLSLAAVHHMDFLLTWNCTHINNGELESIYREICDRHGHKLPVIVNPEEISHRIIL